jgi:stage II sporulation protein AA (anti-sigma F factor antagonist)
MNMEINEKSADRNLMLELSGELDHHGMQQARVDIARAIDTALPRNLILDFTGVTFMDSSGIALLLGVQKHMQRLDGSLLVCNVPQQARRVLDAAGLGRLIAIR